MQKAIKLKIKYAKRYKPLRHSREGGNPVFGMLSWIPALRFAEAGMTCLGAILQSDKAPCKGGKDHNAMRPTGAIITNQRGSVIIIAMIMLVLLTIIGVSATNTSNTEVQIATNEQLHKIAFYAADGGTEAGIKLLHQNIIERDWSDNAVLGDLELDGYTDNGMFYTNDIDSTPDPMPSDTNRDAFLPAGDTAGQPHTNSKYRGT